MEKTMANVEKKMAVNKTILEAKLEKLDSMETNIAKMETNMEKMETNMTKIATNMAKMELNMTTNVEKNIADMKTDMDGKLEAVNNEVKGLKAALIEGFNEMKEVLVKVEDMKQQGTRDVRGGASGDKEKENIIVAGGCDRNSVEIFNWHQKLWSPLTPLPKKRYGAISFVYNNHVTIAGGYCSGSGCVGMIKMNIDPNLSFSAQWIDFDAKLPAKLRYHSSVLHNDQLIVTGGHNGNAISDCIDEVQLVPPYAVKTLSRMPEPRQVHSTEIIDGNLLIVGGKTTGRCKETLSSVVRYDIKKNECKQLAPLPYEVYQMATVRWGDNIVVIGGLDKHGKALDTVIIYNVKTEQHHMLPSMRCKRNGCTAVVIGNNIVVLGGSDELGHYLKSVEAFNFDRYTWEELPDMSEGRDLHTAVAV